MIRPPPISTLFPYPTLFRFVFVDARRGTAADPQRLALRRQSHAEPGVGNRNMAQYAAVCEVDDGQRWRLDRKSTRLNSSHQIISYAVFCLKKKNIKLRVQHQ